MGSLLRLKEILNAETRRVETGGYERLENADKVVCKSGLEMSVQASRSHYCSPRTDDGFWCEVEVGFPTARVEELMPYVEDAERPTDTVYAYVPIGIVADVIDANGGFADEVTS